MGKSFKSLLFIFFLIISFSNFTKVLANSNDEIYFETSAYYTPLKGQKYYVNGSYWADYKMNCQGDCTITASQNKVRPGVLAAPKKYPLGTKIYFEGIGVGIVEDRGGAIVKAGERGQKHDRIDIWMGYGEDGAYRAAKWGRRIVKGKIVDTKNKVTIEFPKDILNGLQEIKVNPENSNEKEVKLLQTKFKELGLYNGKIDGKYKSIKKDLINFQLQSKIITSKNSEESGWFGPKTYLALLKKYSSKDPIIKKYNNNLIETNPKIKIILEAPEIRLNGYNPQKKEVIKVQKLFKNIGLYSGKIDGNYNSIKNKILEIQKQANIIKNEKSWGAGYFGEKTKAALIEYCEEKFIRPKKVKKRITIDDISYSTLKKVGEKLKKVKLKNKLISKLEKSQKLLKNESRKAKVKYLIKILKS